MYRRSASVLLAAALGVRAVAAQQPALRARAETLLGDWRQANILADLQDSLRLAGRLAGRDTIRVGLLTIVANPSPLPLAQAAARIAPEVERFFGPATRAFAVRPLLIQAVDPDTAAEPPRASLGLPIPWNLDAARLSRLLLTLSDLGGVDPTLRDWLGGAVTPSIDSGPRYQRVYVQLVTAPSRAVRQCFLGDLGACRDALSLTSPPDLLSRWYGPDERRRLVTVDYVEFLDRGARHTAFRSCSAGSDAACLELLNTLPHGSLARPLDYDARYTLLQTAVRWGGPETFQRLLNAPGDVMGSRLATATGMPEDSLVARWRANVLRARPASVALPPWGAWLALGWMGAFATLGFRSSRWRVP